MNTTATEGIPGVNAALEVLDAVREVGEEQLRLAALVLPAS